jgi:hypothetical protein
MATVLRPGKRRRTGVEPAPQPSCVYTLWRSHDDEFKHCSMCSAGDALYVLRGGLLERVSLAHDQQVTELAGCRGQYGDVDGVGSQARFGEPIGGAMAVDAQGNVYVSDTGNNKIRKVTRAGVVSTFAGSGEAGSEDGSGQDATFDLPVGLALDREGNLLVSDAGNKIRKVTHAGVVSTLAGSGEAGSEDGSGHDATFDEPIGLALDREGNVYVADAGNNKIHKVTPAGVVSTLAGSGARGSEDGMGTTATFDSPESLDVDVDGCVYVADTGNCKIRKVTPTGMVSTWWDRSQLVETRAKIWLISLVSVDAARNRLLFDDAGRIMMLPLPPPAPTYPSTFTQDMERLLQMPPDLPDGRVTFNIEGKLFHTSRSLLCVRCPYFQSMFSSGMQESSANEVTLHDIDAPTFEYVLRYLLTDQLPAACSLEASVALMVAASRYGIPRLQANCELQVVDSLDVSNVVPTLEHAHLHSFSSLEDECKEFIVAHREEVKAAGGFKQFKTLELAVQVASVASRLTGIGKESLIQLLRQRHATHSKVHANTEMDEGV